MDLLAKAKQMQAEGRDIIHLEVGEPDFPSPKAVIEAGIKALKAGKHTIQRQQGYWSLGLLLANFIYSDTVKNVSPDQIMITPGASGALQLITSLLVDPDESLLLTDPGYPCNRHFLANINAHGQLVATRSEEGFHLTPSLLEQHWQSSTIGALVASPANPTGALMSTEQLAQLHAGVTDKKGYLIVDEIYHGLTYGQDAETAVNMGDNVFIINSFSKYFSMTGLAVGLVSGT